LQEKASMVSCASAAIGVCRRIGKGDCSTIAELRDMRVAFDGVFLSAPQTGTGRYLYNLLNALATIDAADEYSIVTSDDVRRRPDIPRGMTWEPIQIGAVGKKRSGLEKVRWEQRTFPKTARKLGATLMHVPYFAPPLYSHGVPAVVTILDVIAQRLPIYRTSMGLRAYSELVARAATRAAAVIAISHHSKQEIVETLGIPPERIFVTHLAPDSRLRPASAHAQQEARHRLGLPGPFVLNVGGMDARKHLAGLIEAFAEVYRQMGDPTLKLFVAGDAARLGASAIFPDWRPLAGELGVLDHIHCARVDEADLATLYSAADCFAFTSLYEGFGLTPLEAMACGAPVVCSERTSLPEVVGDAAILVDPEDTHAVSAAILRVLTSPGSAQSLRARGLARAQTFTWDRTARLTHDVYIQVERAKVSA
jgi:glycosyltransferase involved in cell wall biosynthesis